MWREARPCQNWGTSWLEPRWETHLLPGYPSPTSEKYASLQLLVVTFRRQSTFKKITCTVVCMNLQHNAETFEN